MRFITTNFVLAAALAVSMPLAMAAEAAGAPSVDQLSSYFRSVQMDDRRTVARMVDQRIVNPNQADPRSGETGLILALREGAAQVASYLLNLPGMDLEARAPNGNTALMMAAYKNNRPAVEALLAHGARVEQPGWNALHNAAASGADDIARLLLAKGAAVDAPGPAGTTALMMAAREGQESTVALLLAAGADASLRNSENLDAAQIATRAEKPRIAAAIDRFRQGRGRPAG